MQKNKSKFKDFDEYQKFTNSTAVYPKIGKNFVYPVIGLVGEAGEVAEKVKKLFRDDKGKVTEEKKIEIAKELGIHFSDNYKLETEVATKSSIVAKELLNIEQGSPRRV
jgi:hypothetical protein